MVAALVSLVAGLLFSGTGPLATWDAANYGQVHFENSCAPSLQQRLQQAISLLHSFEFGEATAAFHAVESGDSSCTIAAWGVALSNTERDGPDRPAQFLASGWKELQPWLSRPTKTERERMYLDAVSKLYEGYENISGDERWRSYMGAMQRLRSKYPRDQEASLFYAVGLTWTASSGKAGMDQRREALDILLPIFDRY